MTERERFLHTMRYEPVDRRPLYCVGAWSDTLERWYHEGLPREVEVNEYLGLAPLRSINVTGTPGLYPLFTPRVISEDGTYRIALDSYGRTVRDFIGHTSMPEWLAFPVTDAESLRRVLDEHFDVEHLDARYTEQWEETVHRAAASDELVVIDGGCYYWTLRSLAGVEVASYLFYDAPELVDELFERYFTVVMDGLRRVTQRVQVDVIGFGEDIGFKTGPLISPEHFRQFILPRYRQTMELAHELGITLTWYDSDGDVRAFIPDYLAAGIDTLAPCEVAANMSPVALRRQFERDLRMIGGIDKREIAQGKAAIDAEIARIQPLLDEGGYIPAIDHSVSADISFDNYRYFIEKLLKALG